MRSIHLPTWSVAVAALSIAAALSACGQRGEAADPADLKRFPNLKLATIADFGGWKKAQPLYFGDGGVFDQIYKPGQ